MMNQAATVDRRRFPVPQRTTARAGALLLVGGLLLLLQAGHVAVPVTEAFVVPLNGPPVEWAAALLRAAALTLLASGSTTELGIVARSRTGRVALVAWGARDLSSLVIGMLPMTFGSPLGYLIPALQLLFTAAAVIAAVQVIRVRVLWGAARWAFLPAAIIDCLFAAISNLPPSATDLSLTILIAIAAWPTQFAEPALTLLAATALLTWGRGEALKHHIRRIHDAW